MTTISEDLRDIANDEDLGPGTSLVREALTEAADTIDALVEALEQMIDERFEPSGDAVQQAYAALAKAKGKQE